VQGGGQTGEQQASNRVALPGPEGLQVLRLKTGVLGDSRKHTGSDFFAIVECKHKIAPAFTRQRPVRAGLTLRSPAEF